jgi:hypothetical protein
MVLQPQGIAVGKPRASIAASRGTPRPGMGTRNSVPDWLGLSPLHVTSTSAFSASAREAPVSAA